MLFVIHYSFDLRFNDVDVAFVLGSFCLVFGAGVLVLRVDVLLATLKRVSEDEQQVLLSTCLYSSCSFCSVQFSYVYSGLSDQCHHKDH